MRFADARICPSCNSVISLTAARCDRCGAELNNIIYSVVPDGLKFGIALSSEIILHGLELKEAKEITFILKDIERKA